MEWNANEGKVVKNFCKLLLHLSTYVFSSIMMISGDKIKENYHPNFSI